MKEFHPLANVFPLIEGAPFDDLVASIRTNGLINPIILLDGKILDGRNRYRACLAAGVEPDFMEFPPDDEKCVALVEALNLHRRHLDESQRAMVAADLMKYRGVPLSVVVSMLNVSDRNVSKARTVIDKASPNVVQLVRDGTVSVHRAELSTRKPMSTTELLADNRGTPGRPRGNMHVTALRNVLKRAKDVSLYEEPIVANWPGDPDLNALMRDVHKFLSSMLKRTQEKDHAAAVA